MPAVVEWLPPGPPRWADRSSGAAEFWCRLLATRGASLYFEWVQGLQHFLWTEQEVNSRLIELMKQAFREVLAVATAERTDMRTAALMRGIGRITEAKRRRGIFP